MSDSRLVITTICQIDQTTLLYDVMLPAGWGIIDRQVKSLFSETREDLEKIIINNIIEQRQAEGFETDEDDIEVQLALEGTPSFCIDWRF